MLEERIAEFRSLPYAELRALAGGFGLDPEDRFAPSGRLYQFEFFASEDDSKIHVFLSLFEERKVHRAIETDFLIGPDGTFEG
jgi:hypothetical protein